MKNVLQMTVQEFKEHLALLRRKTLEIEPNQGKNRPASMCKRGKAIGSVKRRR